MGEWRKRVVSKDQALWYWTKEAFWSGSIRPGASCLCDRCVTAAFSPINHTCSFSLLLVDRACVNRLNS